MNAKSILKGIAIYALVMNLIQPSSAQSISDVNPGAPTEYMTDSLVAPIGTLKQDGTADMQGKLLLQINDALESGSLSALEAADLKLRLNQINQSESRYVSLNQSIPASLVEQDKKALIVLTNELEKKPHQAQTKEESVNTDIEGLIGNALARNRISSEQAEQYYLRLGQIELDLSNAQRNPAQLGNQLVTMRQSLNNLRNELMHKIL